jgi:hypothetical protein
MAADQKRARSRARPLPDSGRPLRVAVLLAALFPTLMILLQVTGSNGPSYWRWRYVDQAVDVYLVLAAAAGGLLFWAWRRQTTLPLMLAQGMLLFSFVSLSHEGLDAISSRIRNPDITSYYTEAAKLHDLAGFLRDYDKRLPAMQGHAMTHPPGPILYFYAWQRLAGEAAALWSGVALMLALTLGVPLIYFLTERLAKDRHTALAAAAMWAVLPGLVTIAPAFDPLYAVFTLALVYAWTRAAGEGARKWAVAWGAAWFAALCFTHSFLTLGAFFVLTAVLDVGLSNDRSTALRRIATSAAIGSAVLAGCFTAAWVLTGYNHLAALRTSLRIQEPVAQMLHRRYRLTVFWDLYDFSLAAGWVPVGLVVAAAAAWRSRWAGLPHALRVVAPAGLATILIVDLTGLLRAETARVWLFLQPFVILPAAVALRSWPPAWQRAGFGVLLFALAVIAARLAFI